MKLSRAFATALILFSGAALAQTTDTKPCGTPEYRQFDFWLGKWDVFPKAKPGERIANSLIESVYGGCGIRESWMPFKGGGGGSLNTFRPDKNRWRQFWIDSQGSMADFIGGWNGKAMVLEGVWPQSGKPNQMTHMTFTPLSDGSVRQMGESSDDGGKTWQPSFDLIYRRAKQ
ncbi:MAG: hypothetical protein ACT4OG_08885 [Alphaproteobacteria bacterium]